MFLIEESTINQPIVFLFYIYMYYVIKPVFKGHCDERTTCDQGTLSELCPIFPMLRNLWWRFGLVCWSLTSLCHSNGHIETMPAREINPFTALTRIRSQFLRTQWSTSNHQRVDTTTPQTAEPSGLAPHSVVTHIGSVTRDQKVPGLNPVWVGCCGVDIYQWCLTGLIKAWWCA